MEKIFNKSFATNEEYAFCAVFNNDGIIENTYIVSVGERHKPLFSYGKVKLVMTNSVFKESNKSYTIGKSVISGPIIRFERDEEFSRAIFSIKEGIKVNGLWLSPE